MTISAERRDEILEDCDRVDRIGAIGARVPTDELRTLLHDSARLERIEKLLREIAQRPHETGAMKLYFRDDKKNLRCVEGYINCSLSEQLRLRGWIRGHTQILAQPPILQVVENTSENQNFLYDNQHHLSGNGG